MVEPAGLLLRVSSQRWFPGPTQGGSRPLPMQGAPPAWESPSAVEQLSAAAPEEEKEGTVLILGEADLSCGNWSPRLSRSLCLASMVALE